MTAENRRADPRFNLHLSAEITTLNDVFTATTRDLSVGGSCLESAYPLKEGSEIQISLFLVVNGIEDADTPPLVVGARVQWTAENDEAPIESRHLAGVRFEGATDEQRAWLEDLISRSS